MPQVKSGNSNTKIVVLSASAIQARGYSANIHPEGYVYFTKNNESSPGGSADQNAPTEINASQQVNDGDSNEVHSENVYWQQGAGGYNMIENSDNLECGEDQNMSEPYAAGEHAYFVNVKNEQVYNVSNEDNAINYEHVEEHANHQMMEPLEGSYDNSGSAIPVDDFQNSPQNQGSNIYSLLQQNPSKEVISIQTEQDDNNRYTRQKITYTFATGSGKVRKLHKSYINSWSKDIEKHGLARCLIASCNFLSLNLFDMQEHYKSCDGAPSYVNNLCNICNGRLPSPQQLNTHMSKCEGQGRQVTARSGVSSTRETDLMSNFRIQEWGKQIMETGTAACGIAQCNFQASNIMNLQSHQILCDGMAHYDSHSCMLCRRWFGSKEDLAKHQPYCPGNKKKPDTTKNKKPDFLHFKDIQRINRGVDINMDCIVQPSPPIPDNIYLRRRGYTKQHKASWEAAMKKNNYVKCMFKNCYFLGMSLEDMISHFGYCSGDGSFAKYTCQYCQGRVTSNEILNIHVQRSHLAEYEAEIAREANNKLKEKHRVYKISEIKNIVPKKEEMEVPEENPSYDFYDSLYGEPECSITINKPVPVPENINRIHISDNLVEGPKRRVDKVVRTYQRKNKNNKFIQDALKDIQGEAPCRAVRIPESIAEVEPAGTVEEQTEPTENFGQFNEERVELNSLDAAGKNNFNRGIEQVEEVTFTPSSYEISQQEHRSINEAEVPIQEMNSLLITNNEGHREIDPLCIENERNEIEENRIFLKREIHQEDRNVEMQDQEPVREDPGIFPDHKTVAEPAVFPDHETVAEPAIFPCHETVTEPAIWTDHVTAREEQTILPEITSEQPSLHAQTFQAENAHEETFQVGSTHEDLQNENQLNLFPIAPDEPEPEPVPLPKETRRSTRQRNSNAENQQSFIQIRNSFSLSNHEETVIPGKPETQTKKRRGRKRKAEETVHEEVDIPIEPEVILKPRGRRRGRILSDESEDLPLASLKMEESVIPQPQPIENANVVKCGKCEFETSPEEFEDHNYKKHAGTGWIEGQEPFDMENIPLLESTVKKVFRLLKSVKCEVCGTVKKSALGYVSHIQNCGKSKEEREALKVECLECGAKVLRYSLPIHMKLSHPDPLPELENYQSYAEPEEELPEHLAGKRRSAVKAATKFHSVLRDSEEDDAITKSLSYVFYQKNSSAVPKLPRKIQNLWSKMKKEGRRLPCRRAQCFFESDTLQEARRHHFLCPELPDEVYVCECCDYYTENEVEIKNHAQSHLEPVEKDFAYSIDEFHEAEAPHEMDLDENIDDTDDFGSPPQRKNFPRPRSSDDVTMETEMRRDFMIREKLINPKNNQLYHQTLAMTLEAEEIDSEDLPLWPEFRTKETDWIPVEDDKISEYLPPLSESVSVHISREKIGTVDWKVFKRFESDNVGDSPVMFTGGSVISMSWCRIFADRLREKSENQYLAITTSQSMDVSRNIRERSSSPGLVQIWDCGILDNSRAMELPRMVLGIAHNGGEISDLSWLPADLYSEGTKEYLPRIGVLGAACQDGNVRVWSVCDPSGLSNKNELRIYEIQPSVILKPSDESDVCLKLAISRKGLVAGGYSSGIVYLWNLECINSPFTKTEGKTYIVRPYSSFMAHRSPITALAMSQVDGHFIGTSGYDRAVKFWDVQFPSFPTEVFSKETGLDIVFPRHWPITFFSFEDVVAGASKAVYKAIKDLVFEGHRTALCLESVLWNLSFSDWLNTLCGSSLIGEVKIRFFRNIFMADQKHGHRAEAVLSSAELRRLNPSADEKGEENGKAKSKDQEPKVPRTYEEAKSSFGLVITDYSVDLTAKKDKVVKHKFLFDEYPIKSATRVCFNPNFESFTHLAIGYHCGLVRIVTLEKIQRDLNLIKFINRHKAS